MKPQAVRLVDVFLLGPFMMWAGSRRKLPGWASATLTLSGWATVLYNATNYLHERKRLREVAHGRKPAA
jgi:hypothetical protein